MKKYLISAAVIAMAASAAHANHHKSFGGFSVGLTGGYGMGSANVVTAGTGLLASSVTQKNNLALKGFNGGLFLNYGWMFQKSFYVGLEAYGKLSNVEGTQEFRPNDGGANANKNSTIKAKNTNAFGAALRLGGVINSMLTYVKVGVESANWKFEQANDQIILGAARSAIIGNSKSRRLTGIPIGIGMETMLSDRLVFGGEFVYTHYGSTTTVATQQTNAGATSTISNKFRPKKSEFNVRLAYKF